MATVQEIREGIDDRLATVTNLRHDPVVPKSLNPPPEGAHAFVKRRSTTFDVSMDGEEDLTFAVTVAVSWADQRAAQLNLDPYLAATGAKSVKAAIDGDPTLGGIVNFCRVASVEEERVAPVNQVDYLAADLVLEVG